MHITIDTNHPTELDIKLLKLMLGDYLFPESPKAPQTEDVEKAASTDDGETATPAAEPEQPKRKRRTKAEMEAARAAEEAAKAEPADEPTADSENAESDAAEQDETPAATGDSISIAEVTELATQLIQKDRSAMVDLLKQFGARRVSEIPESDLGKFASEIRSKLA